MRDIRKTILLTSTRSYIVILGYITWTSIVHEDRGVAGYHIVRVDVSDREGVDRAVLVAARSRPTTASVLPVAVRSRSPGLGPGRPATAGQSRSRTGGPQIS